MPSKTPSRNDPTQFTPKEFQSPNKDQPGISNSVFSCISNLHSFLSDWSNLRKKGTRLLWAIHALKLYECNIDYYPSELKPLMESIVEIVDSLKVIVEEVEKLHHQMNSLAKLQPGNEAVISSWSLRHIAADVENIYESLSMQYKLKVVVTENVAHCRQKLLLQVYIASWDYEPNLKDDLRTYLFAELGLPAIK